MRFFANYSEALNELRRELKEMGVRVSTKSVQNKNIENNSDYEMLEITNYTYLITSPNLAELPVKDLKWCEEEFKERVSGEYVNPGDAWGLRHEYWKQFQRPDGTFDYTYPERMVLPLGRVIDVLKKDLNTRRAFLPIFDRCGDNPSNLSVRIPCSLGYWFDFRQDKLNVTYLQRSADLSEHFRNDIYLAYKLCEYVASEVGVPAGTFCHWLGSFHCFSKDLKGVF
jgi:thymidylate synthase